MRSAWWLLLVGAAVSCGPVESLPPGIDLPFDGGPPGPDLPGTGGTSASTGGSTSTGSSTSTGGSAVVDSLPSTGGSTSANQRDDEGFGGEIPEEAP